MMPAGDLLTHLVSPVLRFDSDGYLRGVGGMKGAKA